MDDAREEEGKGKVSGNTRGGREEEKIEKQKSEVDDERGERIENMEDGRG